MIINEDTITEINELVSVALRAYETEIELLYGQAAKGLTVGLGVEFSPFKDGGMFPAVTIKLTSKPITEKFTGRVIGQEQLGLGYPVKEEG